MLLVAPRQGCHRKNLPSGLSTSELLHGGDAIFACFLCPGASVPPDGQAESDQGAGEGGAGEGGAYH